MSAPHANSRTRSPTTPDASPARGPALDLDATHAALSLGPQLAAEGARFWARRLHAYADWMDQLSRCANPMQLAETQARFLSRTQDDYASEGATLADLATAGLRTLNGQEATP